MVMMCYCIKMSHRGSEPSARYGTLLRIITIPEQKVQLDKSVRKVKRSWKICQLAVKGSVTDFGVHHINRDITGIRKTASYWVPCHLNKAQNWHRYAIANRDLQWYHKEGNALLCHTAALDDTPI